MEFGKTAIRKPSSENTAKNVKMLAVSTHVTCTAAKRTNKAICSWEAQTTSGNRTEDAAFTSIASRATRYRMAMRLAKKMLRVGIGSGTRLKKSRRSGKMLSQRQTATAPVTTM